MASWQASARRADLRHGSVRAPRRVSGPLRPHPVAPVPSTHGFDRVRSIPDSRVLDKLLRSRAWIWLIGIGLGGIVAMQVSMLKLNAGISRAVEASATLERQNAELEGIVAQLASGQRIRTAARNRGMVLPEAGSIGFLNARSGEFDASRAARRMQPPSSDAMALLANGGRVPGALAPVQPATTTTITTTTTAAAQPTVQAQPAPAAQQQPVAQQTAPPAPTPAADPQAATAGGASPPTG